jgi:polyhydroxyalkanoate synthesis regulator protein
MDHKTEEHLTAGTFTQIIFEQEKKKGGFLPKSVLTNLVRSGGDTLSTTLRRTMAVPRDFFQQVDKEIERRLQALINKGDLAKEEGLRLRDKLLSQNNPEIGVELPDEEELESLLSKHGVPTRDDLDKLNQQIESLTTQLDSLIQEKREAGSGSE